uniref:Uncharacterized protein TCIL3000_11_15860 n=1 Tax=Trypanosoma congolense (strain IL3000) TaxID=1068625 RepID=G0V353_TRYCI|nr:unnamed protein product [Trypanosoma congolense IL3000]
MGRGFEHFVVVIRWVNSFGATVSYVISVGHIITPIVCEACGSPSFLKSWGGVRLLTFATWAIFMLPLVLPKKVNSLRYVSAFAMSFVLYFVLAVVIHGAQSGLPKMNSRKDGDEDGVRLFNTGNSAISALGVFMFSYVCQINCYEVYWEMKRCSASRFTSYAAISMAFCGVLYALTIIFAYGEFGGLVDNSVLLMYNPVVELMMMFGFVGMVIKLCVGYALQTMALRNTIYHVLRWDVETLPYWKHFSLVIPLSIVILIAGLFIPNINTVFGLVGAICGGFLSFIFPSLFYMYSGGWTRSKVGNFHYFCTYFLLLAGVVGLVFGTVSVAYENIVYLLMGDASAGNVAKDMCGNNIPVV